jgi:hypothetical protein
MKNVAKCDTWCELQDPANHRVFERKLRPEPFGRGHACLGVTHRCPPAQPPSKGFVAQAGAHAGLPCAPSRGWLKFESSTLVVATLRWLIQPRYRVATSASVPCPSLQVSERASERALLHRPFERRPARATLSTRPQVRRDYPLNLSISISGGKETYKDSPSNGERTGKCPA